MGWVSVGIDHDTSVVRNTAGLTGAPGVASRRRTGLLVDVPSVSMNIAQPSPGARSTRSGHPHPPSTAVVDVPLASRGTPPSRHVPSGGSYLVGLAEDGAAACGGGVKSLGRGVAEIKRFYVAPVFTRP
jgi:hypothetical protein